MLWITGTLGSLFKVYFNWQIFSDKAFTRLETTVINSHRDVRCLDNTACERSTNTNRFVSIGLRVSAVNYETGCVKMFDSVFSGCLLRVRSSGWSQIKANSFKNLNSHQKNCNLKNRHLSHDCNTSAGLYTVGAILGPTRTTDAHGTSLSFSRFTVR